MLGVSFLFHHFFHLFYLLRKNKKFIYVSIPYFSVLSIVSYPAEAALKVIVAVFADPVIASEGIDTEISIIIAFLVG
mgnify:CR=1 FL=1